MTNEIVRHEFGASQATQMVETTATAVAAQAQAMVQARYVMAMKQPRNWDLCRQKLMRECQRAGFADAAEWEREVWKWNKDKQVMEKEILHGPSIRFIEAALRAMTNVFPEHVTVYDGSDKRISRVMVTDLEANLTYSRDIVVQKTVERKKLKKGQLALGERTNSYGDTVYIVEATDDEVTQREQALVSKSIRVLGQRLIPADIVDDCIAECNKTLSDPKGAPQRLEASRRKLIDDFAGIGVTPADLAQWLGHDTSAIDAGEGKRLRGIFNSIKDGDASWADILAEKLEAQSDSEASKKVAAEAPQGRAALLREVSDLRLKGGADAWAKASAKFEADPKTNWHQKATDAQLGELVAVLRSMGVPATAETNESSAAEGGDAK